MNKHERDLFSVACKKQIDPYQKIFKTIEALETYEKFERYKECMADYKEKIRAKIEVGCEQIIDIIEANVLAYFNIERGPNWDQNKCYFFRLKADYQRYICEVATFNQDMKMDNCK